MARRDPRMTYRNLQRSQAKIEEARRELEAEPEEPIHRYTFPIPPAVTAAAPVPSGAAASAVLTQILEQVQYQNQLLVDLLGAVNSLTAALLCKRA